jgi:hypothetical protein
VVRHSLLWFTDGNIVMRTSSLGSYDLSPVYTLYKVHKSILALNATFFADTFSGGTDLFDSALGQYDGTPVIDMPEPAMDVEIFLKAALITKCVLRHIPAFVSFNMSISKAI